MANTTNYNWETPDNTDLVKDGAAAIRTLGSSIDTTTKNLNPQTTTGALAYRSATANVNTALPIGTTGQVLTVAAGVPTWAAPAAGGKVLQVVSATTSTTTTNATATYADTTLTGTITPSSATSKILVLVSQNGCFRSNQNSDNAMALKLVRTSTDIALIASEGMQTDTAFRQGEFSFGIVYLDAPATTSATTYKTQFKNKNVQNRIVVQEGSSVSTITLMEIGA